MLSFRDPPRVTLTKTFTTPFANAVATARTCYASRIITDADVEKNPEMRDRIAQSVYLAGHHTTLQHAHFQFALEGVSRQALWSFFHAHPFYNSEQVSQRYVEVKAGNVLVPELGAAETSIYTAATARQMATYQRLREALVPAVSQVYFGVFPGRKNHAGEPKKKNYARAIGKKCQEMARYVLPVATHAHLYHTISGLTLHRYHRLAAMHDCPSEQRAIIDAMVRAVRDDVDEDFFRDIEETLPVEKTAAHPFVQKYSPERAARFVRSFDEKLGGRHSKLIRHTENPAEVMADALRDAFALTKDDLSDEEALRSLLDPSVNPYLGESLNLNSLSKWMRPLRMVEFTFKKALSHSADSQGQRHRMTPGVRPVLYTHIVPGQADYVTPAIFEHDLAKDAKRIYDDEMKATWDDIRRLYDAGVSAEAWQYLLPNAVKVRYTETGPLVDQHHKWTTRLCYNAQEEIWRVIMDEVEQVAAVAPTIGQYLLPPCGLRAVAKRRPICPERDRFCGVTVWRSPRKEWLRVL